MNPWEEYPEIWNTQSKFMSWLRGGIRRSLWNKSPIKIEFIKKNRIRIKNPKKSKRFPEVWGGICNECGSKFILKDLQVDHLIGNHSLKEIKDIQKFIESIVMVRFDDLQFLCKECHKDKSYFERYGKKRKKK